MLYLFLIIDTITIHSVQPQRNHSQQKIYQSTISTNRLYNHHQLNKKKKQQSLCSLAIIELTQPRSISAFSIYRANILSHRCLSLRLFSARAIHLTLKVHTNTTRPNKQHEKKKKKLQWHDTQGS